MLNILVTLAILYSNHAYAFKLNEYLSQVDYTHDNITRSALDRAAAFYIATVLRPGQFDLGNQTTRDILKQYFSEVKSAKEKYEIAVEEIVEGLNLAETDKQISAKFTMNNEMIVEGNRYLISKREQIVSLSKVSKPDWTTIRMQVGLYLYTLQDFYSNTNWIEIGGRVHETLGWNDSLGIPVAGYYQATCRSCRAVNGSITSNGTCDYNLIVGNVLTSGYVDWSSDSSGGIKPYSQNWQAGEGKCSHGGAGDTSRFLPATGGINKETISPTDSPHYHLHWKAGSFATDATTKFFVRNETSLLTVMGYIRLGQLLGLEQENQQSGCVNCNDPSVSIVFVIDTTGSMSNDIFQVREKAVEIVAKAMTPGFTPANYILVTFNDPASLTTYQVSTNGEEVKKWLNGLIAHGGDDCPEYAMTGLKTAMEHAKNGSCVFFFTDADPKDPELLGTVQNLISSKNLHLVSIITGQCHGQLPNATSDHTGGSTSGIGCISKSQQHRKRRGWGNFFQQLGGSFIPVKDRDISKPLDTLLEKNMAIKYVNTYTTTLSHNSLNVTVDSHITAFTIEIKGGSSALKTALLRPDGSTEMFTGKNSFNDIGRNTYIMSVASPMTGIWNLKNPNSDTWTVTIKQQGDIEFTETFLETVHGSLIPIHGSTPLAGSNLTLLVKVSDLSVDDSLQFAVIFDERRNEITRLKLKQSRQGRKTVGISSFIVPNKPFKVAIDGRENGNLFRRESINIIRPSSASLHIVRTNGDIYVGKEKIISCNVTNTGSRTERYRLRVTDSAGFIDETKFVTVDKASSDVIPVTIRAHNNVKTTVLTARLFFGITEIQKEVLVLMVHAVAPPTVTVIDKTLYCDPASLNYFNCSREIINVSAVVSSTSSVNTSYTRPELDTALRNKSLTISGNCCTPKFTLFVFDSDNLHSEITFDFTNGHPFSTVLPVVQEKSRSSKTSKFTVRPLVWYAVGAVVAACLLTIGIVVLFIYIYGKTKSKIGSTIKLTDMSENKVMNNNQRLPRSHLQQFHREISR